LTDGAYPAGDALAELYAGDVERRRDLVEVRRQQARLKRGHGPTLANLLAAARADGDETYAAAVAHVLAVVRGEDAPAAPPLDELPAQPEATTRLLAGAIDGTVCQALAVLCRAGVQRREMPEYDLSGNERVAPGAATPLGGLVGALARLFELEGVRV